MWGNKLAASVCGLAVTLAVITPVHCTVGPLKHRPAFLNLLSLGGEVRNEDAKSLGQGNVLESVV